jgi:hypothetical protein
MPELIPTDPVARAAVAFARHAATAPFDSERDASNSARQTIADTVRETVTEFGPVRRHWPHALLVAAAPYDGLAQLALGGSGAKRVYSRPPASAIHPHDVRRHRPHNPNAGIDWQPVIPADDLAVPNYGVTR